MEYINSRELMIGNFINHKIDGFVEVAEIKNHFLKLIGKSNYTPLSSLTAIPITEENLIKFGFEIHKRYRKEFMRTYELNNNFYRIISFDLTEFSFQFSKKENPKIINQIVGSVFNVMFSFEDYNDK